MYICVYILFFKIINGELKRNLKNLFLPAHGSGYRSPPWSGDRDNYGTSERFIGTMQGEKERRNAGVRRIEAGQTFESRPVNKLEFEYPR